MPQRSHRLQMYVQRRHKTTAEASVRWLIDQSHKGVGKRPWSLSYSFMSNALCCWSCRILSDLSVRLLTHCPSHTPFTSSSSYCLSFSLPLSQPSVSPSSPPPQTHVGIKSLLVTWCYLRRHLKLQFNPTLSLSLNQDNFTHVTHSDSPTYLLAQLQDSHTDSTHGMLLADWPNFNLGKKSYYTAQ